MWLHEQHTQRQNGRGIEAITYEAKYDGKDYMVTGAAFDAVSFTRTDTTMTRTAKNRGQQVETAIYTLSPDRQTLTVVTKGMNYGITYGSTQVFERETDASN